jgi:hypothetical protein
VALVAAVLGSSALLGIVGAVLTHASLVRSSVPSLPELHGQVTWAPEGRPAPARALHGRTAAVAFLGRGCASCLAELRRIVRRLPAAQRPLLVLAAASSARAYGVAPGRRALVLVDRRGFERTGYAFPLAPAFVELDLRTLARR